MGKAGWGIKDGKEGLWGRGWADAQVGQKVIATSYSLRRVREGVLVEQWASGAWVITVAGGNRHCLIRDHWQRFL